MNFACAAAIAIIFPPFELKVLNSQWKILSEGEEVPMSRVDHTDAA